MEPIGKFFILVAGEQGLERVFQSGQKGLRQPWKFLHLRFEIGRRQGLFDELVAVGRFGLKNRAQFDQLIKRKRLLDGQLKPGRGEVEARFQGHPGHETDSVGGPAALGVFTVLFRQLELLFTNVEDESQRNPPRFEFGMDEARKGRAQFMFAGLKPLGTLAVHGLHAKPDELVLFLAGNGCRIAVL